jgi:hypothetical protein
MAQDETPARIQTPPAEGTNVQPAETEARPKRVKVKTAVRAGEAVIGGGTGNGTTFP